TSAGGTNATGAAGGAGGGGGAGGSGGGTGGGSGGGGEQAVETYDEPSVIAFSTPEYPTAARKKRVAGSVGMLVHVRRDGLVDSVRIVRGLAMEELNRIAVDATRQSRWRPARRGDRPVEAWVEYRVTFGP